MTTAASAPPAASGRDRLITAIRGFSMVAVVIVHVGFSRIDGVHFSVLAPNVWLDIASWCLVWVIGGFFMSSGALLKRSAEMPVLQFWRKRALRLLVPYYVFALIVVPVEYLLFNKALGVCSDFGAQKIATWVGPMHMECLEAAQGPGWFLAVFIPIVLALPWLRRLYDSRARYWFPAVSFVALVGFDVFMFSQDGKFYFSAFVQNVANGGFNPAALAVTVAHTLLFWTIVLYGGFFYADRIPQRLGTKLLPLGLGLLFVMAALVTVGPYNENAFGFSWPGSTGNQFPPTITWMLGTAGWFCVFMYLRRPIEAWSNGLRTGRVLDWCAKNSLTILIWHMTLYSFLYWALRFAGGGDVSEPGVFIGWLDSLPDGLSRPLWVASVWALLVPFVNVMVRVEERAMKLVDGRVGWVSDRLAARRQPAEQPVG